MSEQPDKPAETNNPQHDVGLMLQRRALHRLQRDSEKPVRSPKQIAIAAVAALVTICLLLLLIDRSVKVTHRVIDIWTPVIFDTKKPEATSSSSSSTSSIDPAKPYMIRVEPRTQNSQSPQK